MVSYSSNQCASQILKHLLKLLREELRCRGEPMSEIKVNGIPANTTVSHDDLAKKNLEVIGLHNLCSDILSVCEIKPKVAAQDVSGSAGTPKTIFGDIAQQKLVRLVIKFKSNVIRQHVLQAKRLHRVVKFEDLVEDGPENVITLYEMLPPLLNDLRLLAKEKLFKWIINTLGRQIY